jgi:hypothetical protein
MIACYSLLDIVVQGQVSQARPIEWNVPDEDGFGNDKNGKPIEATGWHTTCPFCAQLIEFHKNDLFIAVDGTENNVKCNGCKAGSTPKRAQFQPEPKKSVLVVRDPLSDWAYEQAPIDLDKLALFDAELAKPL